MVQHQSYHGTILELPWYNVKINFSSFQSSQVVTASVNLSMWNCRNNTISSLLISIHSLFYKHRTCKNITLGAHRWFSHIGQLPWYCYHGTQAWSRGDGHGLISVRPMILRVSFVRENAKYENAKSRKSRIFVFSYYTMNQNTKLRSSSPQIRRFLKQYAYEYVNELIQL